MSQTEAYELGNSRGWDAANYAAAYENASRSDSAPEIDLSSDIMPLAVQRVTGDRRDFERGYEDGWTRFMEHDYPE